MSVTDKLIEAIKQLKRDIIEGWSYQDIEIETYKGSVYRQEHLILENNKILYHCLESSGKKNFSGGSIIFVEAEEFLKAPIEEIVEQINASYYYNVREEEEEE